MKVQEFTSSFSKEMVWSTICLNLVIFGALIYTIYTFANTHFGDATWYVTLFIILILVVTYLYAFMNQIKGVNVTNEAVIIKKMMGDVTIPLNSIVRISSKSSMRTDIRIWGISGLYGHIGIFSDKVIGRYHAYVKDGNNLITIETKDDNYVVSCNNAKNVVTILQKSLHLK